MDSRYPRTLFRGEETCVVTDEDALHAAAADGWYAKPLPGDDEAVASCYETDAHDSGETERRKPGRPRKTAE